MNASSPAIPAMVAFDGVGFGKALVALADPLRRRAYRLTRDSVQADDLLQETLSRAWSARFGFRQGTNLQAWTYTILRNLFLTQRRRAGRVVELDEHIEAILVAVSAGQHEHAELSEVLAAIERLPSDQRSALCAVALEGLDYEAAAAKLDVTLSALKSRVRRARIALAAMVEHGTTPTARVYKRETLRSPSRFAEPTPDLRSAWKVAKATRQQLWIG